ncbi:unnamed protein product [Spirodela intermedia]|uniref:Uncharacterized protein n=1 Tax=Spirodela intermedia TaxID=51605 RepID=A0A7I8J7U9_SPIIN|nr:unnamed protein product [Spirodela intermedia]CAA6666141.1 unnamed protein product [Spirodela intermedia]
MDLAVAAAKKKRTGGATAAPLSIDGAETVETRVGRLIVENPVVIFSRSSCCMCHVMKRLLAAIGVHPMVRRGVSLPLLRRWRPWGLVSPVVFIGGAAVGGLESLMALHLTGELVPKLAQVGALWP